MAAQPSPLSVEEFHKLYDGAKPAYEYWFGARCNRSTGCIRRRPPELCIEILSPGDTLPEALEKVRRYIDWGSHCVWIIDPEKRTAWTLTRERPNEPAWIAPDGSLRIGITEIQLKALFSEVDRKLEQPNS